MEMDEFLTKLGEQAGLDGLCADEDGHCAFMVDEVALHLQYLKEHDSLLIYCSLPLPKDTDPRFFRALLEVNHLFQGTRGTTIAMKPESDDITLQYALFNFRYYTPEDGFNELERFMNALDNLTQFVKNYRPQDTQETAGSGEDFDTFNGLRGFQV